MTPDPFGTYLISILGSTPKQYSLVQRVSSKDQPILSLTVRTVTNAYKVKSIFFFLFGAVSARTKIYSFFAHAQTLTDVVAEIVGRLGVNKRPVQCDCASTAAFEWPRVRILGRQEDRQLLKLQVRMRVYHWMYRETQNQSEKPGSWSIV